MFKRNLLLSALVVSFASGCAQEPVSEEGQIDVIDIPLSEPVATSVEAPAEVATTPEAQTAPAIKPEPAPKPAPTYEGVAYEITKEHYPKTYANWGKEWIDDINRMMPLAVIKAAKNPKCDTPSTADLSDNKSTIKKEAVFYVDCMNRERFYMSQNELNDTKPLVAENDKLDTNYGKYIQICEALTKGELEHPSSFNPAMLSTAAYKGTSGNMVVEMPFTALNSFGAELPMKARCIFSTDGKGEVTITEG